MGVVFAYFKHQPEEGTKWTTFYDFNSIMIRRQLNAKSNTIKITLPNKFGKYSGKHDFKGFKEDDKIYIYARWGAITEADDLLMAATIKELGFKSSGNKREISLICMDRTYQLLNKIYMGGGVSDSDSQNAPETIKKVVDWVSHLDNRDFAIGTDTYIETTPSGMGGTAFDDITLSLNMKTAYEWITELSGDPYTRYDTGSKTDRMFIFWIDKDNEFHWKYPSQTEDATITVENGSTSSNTVSIKKTIFDVINLVIFNAGNDPEGNGVQWYFYDKTSKQPELRARYQPMVDIGKELQYQEELHAAFTSGYPDSYPHTTRWGESVANDAGYLGAIGLADTDGTGFRGRAVREAKQRAQKITARSGDLRWKGTIAMRGTNSYTPGDLFKINYEDANMVNQKLRCKGVEHQITKKGWFTTLTVEEDAKALTL